MYKLMQQHKKIFDCNNNYPFLKQTIYGCMKHISFTNLNLGLMIAWNWTGYRCMLISFFINYSSPAYKTKFIIHTSFTFSFYPFTLLLLLKMIAKPCQNIFQLYDCKSYTLSYHLLEWKRRSVMRVYCVYRSILVRWLSTAVENVN